MGSPGLRVRQPSFHALFSSTDTHAYHVLGLDLGAGGTGANKSNGKKNPALVEACGNGTGLYFIVVVVSQSYTWDKAI